MTPFEENSEGRMQELPVDEQRVIPVMEENLIVTTERIETGRVLVSKKVVEEQVTYDGVVSSDEVFVERKAINQYVDTAPAAMRQEGDVTIISVIKEVLVVEKRLMLVEELHITKRQQTEQKTISESLRKEEISITRDASGTVI